ncbi:MAG: hypothetical protein ACT4OP_03910, partial [Actinomycetota bacterium]
LKTAQPAPWNRLSACFDLRSKNTAGGGVRYNVRAVHGGRAEAGLKPHDLTQADIVRYALAAVRVVLIQINAN